MSGMKRKRMIENEENEDPGFLFAVFVSGHKVRIGNIVTRLFISLCFQVILENEDKFEASSRTYKSKNGDFIAYDQLLPGRKILVRPIFGKYIYVLFISEMEERGKKILPSHCWKAADDWTNEPESEEFEGPKSQSFGSERNRQ